jgi:hypothetical protein
MRELRLFAIRDDEKQKDLEVAAIHDEAGYRRVRESLSHQYDLGSREPNIQVWNVNLRGDRSLTLRHFQHNDRPLHDTAQDVMKHVARLWGFGVHLESRQCQGRRHQALDGAGAAQPCPSAAAEQPRPSGTRPGCGLAPCQDSQRHAAEARHGGQPIGSDRRAWAAVCRVATTTALAAAPLGCTSPCSSGPTAAPCPGS